MNWRCCDLISEKTPVIAVAHHRPFFSTPGYAQSTSDHWSFLWRDFKAQNELAMLRFDLRSNSSDRRCTSPSILFHARLRSKHQRSLEFSLARLQSAK